MTKQHVHIGNKSPGEGSVFSKRNCSTKTTMLLIIDNLDILGKYIWLGLGQILQVGAFRAVNVLTWG